jgi:hypothetical protein
MGEVLIKKVFVKMEQLPSEILDFIGFYLPYEKGISLSPYLNKQLNDMRGISSESWNSNNPWSRLAYYGNIFKINFMKCLIVLLR